MISAKEFTSRDKFCVYNGMEVVSCEPGHAKARMEIKPQHLNGLGTTQGGAIFTLADLAFAAASNCGNEVVTGINVTISYIKATSSGMLTAEAREVARTSKLIQYDVKVMTEEGAVVALFHGTGYVIKSKTS